MAKKLFSVAVILSLIVSFATSAFCEEPVTKQGSPVTKLGRGIANILTFPLEIPEQISRVNNSDGPFAGCTVGVLKGLGWAINRLGAGVLETVTFMSPGSNNYEPVMKDPEYFLENSNF